MVPPRHGTAKNFQPGDGIPNAVKQYKPTTLSQGTIQYLTDIGHLMSNSSKNDGRDMMGQQIIANINNVHYQGVRSQVAPDGGVDVQTMDLDNS